MSIKKSIAACLATLVFVGLGATSAQAYSRYPGEDPSARSTCPSGYGCMWKDWDYESWEVQAYRIRFSDQYRYLNTARYRSDRRDTGLNTGSSFANNGRSGKRVCIYTEVNYIGRKFCFSKGPSSPGFRDWRNDNAESARFEW